MSSSVVSWHACRFLRRQIRWFGIPIFFRIFSFVVIHTVKGFSLVNEAEVDVYLEFSFSSNDLTNVGNLISASFTFSKSSLNIWKFTVHVLLKPGLEYFEHYFSSLWGECNCVVVWIFFGIAFLWYWNENWPFPMKNDLFQSCGHSWVFQICWHIECSTLTASSFGIFK